MTVMLPNLICDFCSSPDVRWRYPARSFVIPKYAWESVTDWAACGECKRLIEAGNHDGLITRSVDMFYHHHPHWAGVISRDILTATVIDGHSQFFANRTGTVMDEPLPMETDKPKPISKPKSERSV